MDESPNGLIVADPKGRSGDELSLKNSSGSGENESNAPANGRMSGSSSTSVGDALISSSRAGSGEIG